MVKELREVSGSNRTIVGLKLLLMVLQTFLQFLQQSHHCGIETQQWVLADEGEQLAAIAPLWD